MAESDAGVHAGGSLWIADRVHTMVDINDDTKLVGRRAEVTGVVRRRRWRDEEKGRIVAEAITPGAVIADVARRHDLTPQHLWNWIRAARQGRFALPGDGLPAFVPVLAVERVQANEHAMPQPHVAPHESASGPRGEPTVAGRGGGFLGWTCRAGTWPLGQLV